MKKSSLKIKKSSDREISELISREFDRQTNGLEMIPSENHTSAAVLSALGSVLNDKYSEGYPGKRYYGGNQIVDQIEILAEKRAQKLFDVPHANIQPYSGSPANLAVYTAICNPGDTVLGLNLPDGGHLTHGWSASATSKYFKTIPYHVEPNGKINLMEVAELARLHRPKLIWVGATAYPFKFDYQVFAKIADEVGAYLAADIAHVAGLIVSGAHPSPVPYAHVVTTTTHKTLRGPRGAMIMVTRRGLKKDPELADKIDRAVFPGLQGGPHNHQTAALAVALKEASSPTFHVYGKQIVKNSIALAENLKKENLKLVGDGTENHMILLDLTPIFGPGGGLFAQDALGAAGITVNKNTIPSDPSTPFYPSGLRLGTPALTTRGMEEKEMKQIGHWIAEAIRSIADWYLPLDGGKDARLITIKKFHASLPKNKTLSRIHTEILKLTKKYPLPSLKP